MFFNAVYGIFCLFFSYLPSNTQNQLSVAQWPSQWITTAEELHSTYVPGHDFQTDGKPASWSPEHPKQWGSEITRIGFPLSTPNFISLSDDDRLLAIVVGEDIYVYTVQRFGPNGDKVNLQQKRIFHSAHGGGRVSFVEFQPGGSGLLMSSGMSTDCWTREYTIKVWDVNMDEEEDNLGLVAEKAAKHASQILLSQQNSFSNMDIARGFEAVLRNAQLKVGIKNGSVLQGRRKEVSVLHGRSLDRNMQRAFSHDGSFLLVFPDPGLNEGKSVTVVAADSFHERYQLMGHSDKVMWAEFSPDDRFIATSSWDKTVRIWNAVNGDLIHTLTGATDQSCQGIFSPDGKLIAVGARDNQVRIWNVESGELLHTLHGYTGWSPDRSFHFSPDGKVLAAGGAAGTLRVFDVSTGESIHYWQAAIMQNYMAVTNVQYTVHGLLLFKFSDGRQYTFDARTNQKGLFEDGQNPGEYALGSSNSVVSSDGSLLFTVDSDRSVRVWRL